MLRILLFFALSTFAIAFAQPPFDEAQVFEWWDDGIITAEEADEIFSRLEEENYDEACLLAEVYAQEPCSNPPDSETLRPKAKRKTAKEGPSAKSTHTTKAKPVPSIVPHGRISRKMQYDSDGHLKKHHEELQVQFYYFKLRLGSQELLSYHRDNVEAHFGQISTLEFHSHIPLDTSWGVALLYPIGKLRFGAFLDTSKAFHTHIGFRPNRENEISATFWKFTDASAIALQARTTLGQISTWYQFGQDQPLVKIQLQSGKKWISWKTTAYLHGDSIPQGLNLSKGIAENKLWASQTVNVQYHEAWNTLLSIKARVLSPIASDSVSARFKLSLESGPELLRPGLSVTCIEASDNCHETEWKGSIESAWEQFLFKASARFRHENRTRPPQLEFGASYRSSLATAKLAVTFPQANPAKAISVQNEVQIDTAPLGCSFVFAFKKTKTKPFRPNFAHVQLSFKF